MKNGNGKEYKVSDIKETTDYSRFIFSNKNRPIDLKHVKKIMAEIAVRGVRKSIPIVVRDRDENGNRYPNGGLLIMEGQHREKALETMKLPVPYIIDNNCRSGEERYMQIGKSWALTDFLHVLVQDKKENYICLDKFYKKHGLPLSTCIELLGNRPSIRDYKDGKFIVKGAKTATKTAELFAEIKAMFPEHKKNVYIRALEIMVKTKKFSHKQLVKKMRAKGSELVPYHSTELYLMKLEDIYNYHMTSNKKLKFTKN